MELSALARQFQAFSDRECEFSPLYRRLTAGVAADPEVLALAQPGLPGPKPNMLLAAVHFLLLKGTAHPLAARYRTVAPAPPPGADADPYPLFRAFCLEHAAAIQSLLAVRRVQTNEVARCAILLPAFTAAAAMAGRPLTLVEVGTSAGLLLRFDRYGYDYGEGRRSGDAASPLQLRCPLQGPLTPPLPADGTMPAVAERIGLDLNPVDPSDSDAALWLQALVWGDQPERLERLRQATAVAVAHPVRLVAGDALETLPAVLAALPDGPIPLVFHCFTLNQFGAAERTRFDELLATATAKGRELLRLAAEHTRGEQYPLLILERYAGGQRTASERLARFQAHGEWLEWLHA